MTDFVPVLGGVLDGQRVRWQGPRLFALKPLPTSFFVPSDEPPDPAFPEQETYEAWSSWDGEGRCYVEIALARQIEADRKREQTLADLRSVLAGVLPNPSALRVPYMLGEVWWCGDEWCDCYQAQIVGWDAVLDGWRTGYRSLWRGSFHADGEVAIPRRELRACRDYLTLIVPTIAAQIRWTVDDD